jgi:Ser/Thr protein kinase RdoA (MazF antagonist)
MRADLIATQFEVPGRLLSIRPVGSGNINDTFLGVFKAEFGNFCIIIQRIRKEVFPQPEIIMKNLRVLSEHCIKIINEEIEESDRPWEFIQIIKTKTGEDYVLDENGDLWRSLKFIEAGAVFESVQSLEHAFEVGATLGHFHHMVSTLPYQQLNYSLPNFHVTSQSLLELEQAVKSPSAEMSINTSPTTQKALNFIGQRKQKILELENALQKGKLKLSITHGDPKAGNVMIHEENGQGLCLIDCDTVQPGLILNDIADAIRSLCNPAGEDPIDLQSVGLDLNLLSAFFDGYKSQAKNLLNADEIAYLWTALHTITVELGIRFLTDHLRGDVYFKVRQPGHNLHRALVQFHLAESIENQEFVIREILEKRSDD